MALNLVFLGTPEFAVPSLKAIGESSHNIRLVVTQPDKPKGRGLKTVRGPVAQAADVMHLDVEQPQRLPDIKDMLENLDIDGAVVVAYGKMLPGWLLRIGKFGCVNVHPSLLPKYRGASPIESAILCGENETGVSIMKLTEGMDEGPVFFQSKVAIGDDDNRLTMARKLSAIAAGALVQTLDLIELDKAILVEQRHREATYTKKIEKEDYKLKWDVTARSIVNKVRAFAPKPGAYTIINGRRVKILRARICDISATESGEIIIGESTMVIRAKDSGVCIEELQPEGKRAMSSSEYIRGVKTKERLIAS